MEDGCVGRGGRPTWGTRQMQEPRGRAEQGGEWRDVALEHLSQKDSYGSLGPIIPIHRQENRGSKTGGTCPRPCSKLRHKQDRNEVTGYQARGGKGAKKPT